MIQENLHKIRETISEVATHCNRNPEDIRLVAVSKRFPVEVMREAIAAGQMIFGENYIQEAVQKKNLLGKVVKLHFIGNLQSNKAKFAVDTCSMVETVDRLKIAKAMNRYLEETEHSLDVLIQVNIGFDQNKSGVSPDESETRCKLNESLSVIARIVPVENSYLTCVTLLYSKRKKNHALDHRFSTRSMLVWNTMRSLCELRELRQSPLSYPFYSRNAM